MDLSRHPIRPFDLGGPRRPAADARNAVFRIVGGRLMAIATKLSPATQDDRACQAARTHGLAEFGRGQ